MALLFRSSGYLPSSSFPLPRVVTFNYSHISRLTTKCKPNNVEIIEKQRRSAHYHPTVWDHQLIQSLKTPYKYKYFDSYLEELKQEAKSLLKSATDTTVRLELIDVLQRLGLSYHFQKEIKEALDITFYMENDNNYCADLYTTSLRFRLLRQHHYPVYPDVFNKFKDINGRFMEDLNKDVKGLLSLYEASHLSINGDDVLEEALKYTTTCLKSIESHLDISVAKQVQHTLEIPLHWRMPRIEAKNFIDAYDRDDKNHAVLLQLAKLDYNLVQSIHQRDLSDLSWWWSDLGFKEKLTFSRDRLVENFIWAIGIAHEPQYSKCREGLTKFICILTTIDDMYDIYGSLDELELFTEAVRRWDISATEGLPHYMKTCYLAMFNLVNIISNNIKRDHSIDVSLHIMEEWKYLCKSYLKEARWFYNGYTPTLEEYLENGWTSVGGPAAMVHAYILHAENISVESLHCLKHGSELMYWASIITRLIDDLGNAKDEIVRGDVPKSIQCYMKQTGVSEEQAIEHVKGLVRSYWKKLNEESVKSILPKSMINMIINMARTAQCIFEHGDGIGTSDGTTKDTAISLFVEPIPLELEA